MSKEQKLPGKTAWAGRRRPMTRASGYSASSDVRLRSVKVPAYRLLRGQSAGITFRFPNTKKGDRLGFGGWIRSDKPLEIRLKSGPANWVRLVPDTAAWGKFGSQWVSEFGGSSEVRVEVVATGDAVVALHGLAAGIVSHREIDDARPALLSNMWTFAPEGNFVKPDTGTAVISKVFKKSDKCFQLYLKSCNRCGRFLPVNSMPNERITLSFSNHCVSRAPCRHSAFGKIQDSDDPDLVWELEFGFQLECRFCKKFCVNAPLNPQRTAGQMKEDGTRRRGFELLLEHLNEGSPQLEFKNRTGEDLAQFVYRKFSGQCFKCSKKLRSVREMHLDHTRPLALLWPLDEYATSLCSVHNNEKRDRSPVEFYSERELRRLAKISGLKYSELTDPSPNLAAIRKLASRLDWFFETFLSGRELTKINEGKRAADVMIKALQKAINKAPGAKSLNLLQEARRRGFDI